MTITVKPTATAFIRLDGRIGWRLDPALTENLYSDPAGRLVLGRPGVYPVSPYEPYGTFGGMTLPRGIAVHPEGRVVLADPEGHRLLYYVPPFGQQERPGNAPVFWPFRPLWTVPSSPPAAEGALPVGAPPKIDANAEPYRLNQPTDVVFSPAGDLVVADSGNGRVLVFAWPELRVRHVLPLPDGKPVAIAFDSCSNGYVADVHHQVIRRFDPLWRLDPDYAGGAGSLQLPQQIAVDTNDQLLVLDSASRSVSLLDSRGRVAEGGTPLSIEALALFERRFTPPFVLQSGQLHYCWPSGGALPGIKLDKAGRLAGTRLPLLARPQRVVLPRRGVYVSQALDSAMAGCQWHRLVLTASLGAATRLMVQTYASDIPLEPDRIGQLDDSDWSTPLLLGQETLPEVLVQSPPGRYLWLKLEFTGDGEQTPAVTAIEVQAPRQSSLEWLPPPFRSDPDSAWFLDRFLSYSDTLFAEIQYQIEHFARMLDPYSVPAGEFLEWLGSWFDWRFLAEWPDSTRREMIASAISFFRQRGTVDGLRRLLQWHTGLGGDQPQILEHFRLRDYAARRQPGGDLFGGCLYIGGKPLEPEENRLAHWFTIVMPASAVPDDDARETLVRLIEAQKPAHTGFQLRIIDPGIRIGCQSTVGVDMWLGGYPRKPLGEMHLGQSARLADAPARGFRLATTHHPLLRAEGNCS